MARIKEALMDLAYKDPLAAVETLRDNGWNEEEIDEFMSAIYDDDEEA